MAAQSATTAGSGAPLWAGTLKFGVRWKTVTCFACAAISGMDWMAEEPVPITATVLPVKSTPSLGHLPVCQDAPLKLSLPGNCGSFGTDRQPVAITHQRAVSTSPLSVSTVHRLDASSKRAERIRAL